MRMVSGLWSLVDAFVWRAPKSVVIGFFLLLLLTLAQLMPATERVTTDVDALKLLVIQTKTGAYTLTQDALVPEGCVSHQMLPGFDIIAVIVCENETLATVTCTPKCKITYEILQDP